MLWRASTASLKLPTSTPPVTIRDGGARQNSVAVAVAVADKLYAPHDGCGQDGDREQEAHDAEAQGDLQEAVVRIGRLPSDVRPELLHLELSGSQKAWKPHPVNGRSTMASITADQSSVRPVRVASLPEICCRRSGKASAKPVTAAAPRGTTKISTRRSCPPAGTRG